jgi:hypothetical protein
MNYVNVTLINNTADQHLYHATDNNAGVLLFTNYAMAPGDTKAIALFAAPDGSGSMTYGYSGGVDFTDRNLRDGDPVNCC